MITSILILLVLEIISRIIFAIEYRNYHTSIYIQGSALHQSDDTLVFRNRPFYVDYYRQFQFNEEGMRMKAGDYSMQKKTPNDFWVFLFGGSAMEGAGSNKDGEWLDITGVTNHEPQQTIAGQLENILQQRMPGKKVRVFNAANSGYTLWQSMERYRQLASRYKMDWVISMDGENEPPQLQEGETVEAFTKARWEQSPLFRFPHSVIIPFTSHSAFVNSIKQKLFHWRLSARLNYNRENNFPARKRWLDSSAGVIKFALPDSGTARALRSFHHQLLAFDSLLTTRNQPHLLYIQPQIAFRDTALMSPTEKALLHYYIVKYNDPYNNTFKQMLFSHFGNEYPLPAQVRKLTGLHNSRQEVFIDYCHFTAGTNRLIASLMADDILK
jgi:hypothetical protein